MNLIKWEDIPHELHVNFGYAEVDNIDGHTMIFLYDAAEKENLDIIAFASDGIIVEPVQQSVSFGEMINFWISEKGSLDLDTEEKEIIEFYKNKI